MLNSISWTIEWERRNKCRLKRLYCNNVRCIIGLWILKEFLVLYSISVPVSDRFCKLMECDVLLHHLSNSIIGPPVKLRFHFPTLFQMEYAFVQRRKVAPCYSKGGPLMEGLLLWRPPSCSSTIVEQTSSQGQCFWNPNGDALEKILRGKFPFQSSEWHHNVTLGLGYHQF